ncbi:MAG TPA: hypothetical protein PLQ59_07265 [Fervidobacterium sp.]|nr:hypothetical protein [Fervidobacterium sp.]
MKRFMKQSSTYSQKIANRRINIRKRMSISGDFDVKATAHSHTGDKPIGVNNSEHSQAVVSVNLPNA